MLTCTWWFDVASQLLFIATCYRMCHKVHGKLSDSSVFVEHVDTVVCLNLLQVSAREYLETALMPSSGGAAAVEAKNGVSCCI